MAIKTSIPSKYGKIWKNIEKYGKIWKNMGKYGKIWKNHRWHDLSPSPSCDQLPWALACATIFSAMLSMPQGMGIWWSQQVQREVKHPEKNHLELQCMMVIPNGMVIPIGQCWAKTKLGIPIIHRSNIAGIPTMDDGNSPIYPQSIGQQKRPPKKSSANSGLAATARLCSIHLHRPENTSTQDPQ
jgi:hypothetical protein